MWAQKDQQIYTCLQTHTHFLENNFKKPSPPTASCNGLKTRVAADTCSGQLIPIFQTVVEVELGIKGQL